MMEKMMGDMGGEESPKAKMLAKLIQDLMSMPDVADQSAATTGSEMPGGEIEISLEPGKDDEDEVLK